VPISIEVVISLLAGNTRLERRYRLTAMKKSLPLLLVLCLSTVLLTVKSSANSSNSFVSQAASPAENFNQRGATKYQRGDARGAISDFNRAIEIDPKYAEAYINRGAAKLGAGDKQGAIADYSKAISLQERSTNAFDSQNALIYYNRGLVKFEVGDNKGAISDFDRAIKLNPQDAETYCNRGAVKLALGDKKGGIGDLTKGAELFRKNERIEDYQKTMEFIQQSK
jgi:tetratricopeptide (TPR) repeat protein